MRDPAEYIASGALEQYLLGENSLEEERVFQEMLVQYPEVAEAFAELEAAQEALLMAGAVEPAKATKAALFDRLDEILVAPPAVPPILHADSKPEEYRVWTEAEGLEPPAEYDNVYFVPLDQSEQGGTALVWMKDGFPPEVHTDVIEKFYILEGTCEINIEGEVHSLQAGDFLSIPMFKSHTIQVTSDYPCKILLQRIAA